MRTLLFALVALGTLTAMNPTPAAARDYPYCIKGRDYPGNGDCAFDTYRQCLATASGLFAWCDRNPFFAGYVERERAPRRYRHHHRYN
jgi:hypothetical protein